MLLNGFPFLFNNLESVSYQKVPKITENEKQRLNASWACRELIMLDERLMKDRFWTWLKIGGLSWDGKIVQDRIWTEFKVWFFIKVLNLLHLCQFYSKLLK